jgi:hypothetical protein
VKKKLAKIALVTGLFSLVLGVANPGCGAAGGATGVAQRQVQARHA